MKCVLIACSFAGLLAAQEAAPARWSVEIRKTGTVQQIDAGYRKGTPKKGMKIVTVQGLVNSATPDQRTLRAEQILLRAQAGTTVDLVAVGILGKAGDCIWEMTTGFETATLGLHDKAAGTGFSIEKKKKKDPVSITFDKLPDELCFAFNLPETAQGSLTFRIDDATVAVTFP